VEPVIREQERLAIVYKVKKEEEIIKKWNEEDEMEYIDDIIEKL